MCCTDDYYLRYAFSARRGASWAVFVAAGIPIGGGAFMLFVRSHCLRAIDGSD